VFYNVISLRSYSCVEAAVALKLLAYLAGMLLSQRSF